MYKIKLTCYDPPYTEAPYQDVVRSKYERKCDAQKSVMKLLLAEVESLNQPDVDYTPRTNIFVPSLNYGYNGKKYDGAVVVWDGTLGIKGQPVTLYEIVWVNEGPLDEWNQKLREEFGEDITFGLYAEEVEEAEEDDDGNIIEPAKYKYYYRGLVTGKSKLYDTIEEAYEEAQWFMDHIELFVDED